MALLATGCGAPVEGLDLPTRSLETDETLPRSLTTVPRVPAEGLEGKPFFVAQRTPEVGQFPCSTCHQLPLPDPGPQDAVHQTMHTDIKLQHAKESVMECRTCHATGNLDELVLLNGEQLGIDHSYQLCGQCHFQQLEDWIGGAHGKRLGGWRGERVVMNCTGCHDPHAPAFDQRWPRKTPRIPRT